MKSLFSSLQPNGKFEHFSGRPKFFENGNPHVHMLFWTADHRFYRMEPTINSVLIFVVFQCFPKGQWHIDNFTCKKFKTHNERNTDFATFDI